jgi:hypothetical protein
VASELAEPVAPVPMSDVDVLRPAVVVEACAVFIGGVVLAVDRLDVPALAVGVEAGGVLAGADSFTLDGRSRMLVLVMLLSTLRPLEQPITRIDATAHAASVADFPKAFTVFPPSRVSGPLARQRVLAIGMPHSAPAARMVWSVDQ